MIVDRLVIVEMVCCDTNILVSVLQYLVHRMWYAQ